MNLTSPKYLAVIAGALALPILFSGCTTTGFGAAGPGAEGDHMIKRGEQLIAMGKKQQAQGASNISRGQDMINQGNAMKGQSLSAPSHTKPAAYDPNGSNY